MKKTALILLSFLSITCFSQVSKINSERIKELQIQSITGSSIYIKNGYINIEDGGNTFMELYNDEGKLTEQYFTNLDGKNKTNLKFYYSKCAFYDKSEEITKNNGKDKIVKTIKVIYDDLCRESKIISTNENNKISEIEELNYNYENRKVSSISKNLKNEITNKIIFSYPEKNAVEEKAYFENDKFWYHYKIKKDENGNEIESVSFDETGKISNIETTKYQYNNGKVIEELHFTEDNVLKYKKEYLYNSDNLIERITTTSKEFGIDMPNLTEKVQIQIYYYRKK